MREILGSHIDTDDGDLHNSLILGTPTAEPIILALAPIRFSSSAFGANHSRIFQMDLFPENLLGTSQMAEIAKMSLLYLKYLQKSCLEIVAFLFHWLAYTK